LELGLKALEMKYSGINRRHFLAVLGTAFGASACTSISMPKMDDGPPHVPMMSVLELGPAPITGADAKFAIVQITGAPTTHEIAFSTALNREAAARNLSIVPEGAPSATYLIRGYLSAVSDGTGSLLIFVWDVTDLNGKRLHRVSGQENYRGSRADPWSGIGEGNIDSAARRTIDDLVAWSN
jgi:hypothetical protein